MEELIQIDGSHGEGGGQILRTALSLSIITGKPVEVSNLRANRKPPGLKPQHLAAVLAARDICAASVEGASHGSQHLVFRPQSSAIPGDYFIDIGTAGATTLVLQTLLLPLALAGASSNVTVRGGTHVPHAPVGEYLKHVYGALLRDHGLSCRINQLNAGFYPAGGGSFKAYIEPCALSAANLIKPGRLRKLTAHIVTAMLPDHVADRGAVAVRENLRGMKSPIIEISRPEAVKPGAAIAIIAECDNGIAGFSAIGEKGKPMEAVVAEACSEYVVWSKSGAAVDEHLADQLVLPMALTAGKSQWTTNKVTDHLRSVIYVVQRFLPVQASIEEGADRTGTVTIEGQSL